MCLILLAWRAHPVYALVAAANRDEFYRRRSAPLSVWPTEPAVFAGRDLAAGGTWLGVTRAGRFAAVTNIREPGRSVARARSRGELVTNFLVSQDSPQVHLADVPGKAYNGFNLLAADRDELWWYSNRDGDPQRVEPGLHGVSNALLDTPWPKVTGGVAELARVLRDYEKAWAAADTHALASLFTADGYAAQYYVGHGAVFGDDVQGFTVDGSAGFEHIPGVTAEQDRRYYAITVRPQVFVNLVPDHVIVHRMFPLATDHTIIECDWLYLPDVVASGKDVSHSVELFHRVNQQDFAACERCQPAMDSRTYRDGGVLVPTEHHIGAFHDWLRVAIAH